MAGIPRRLNQQTGCLGLAAFLWLSMAVPAQAVTFDFSTGLAGVGGTISLTGPNNATGVDVPIGSLTVVGAPGAGVYEVSSGLLAFDTNQATNFITITGGVPDLGIADDTFLLSGTFTKHLIMGPNGSFLAVQGEGLAEKDPDFLLALGLPPDLRFMFFGFTLSADFDPITTVLDDEGNPLLDDDGYIVTTGSDTGTAISTGIASNAIVLNPPSLLLLGAGLASVALCGRRHVSRKGHAS